MKTFLSGICAICIAYGIINFFTRENGVGKMTRFICSVCFLASLFGIVPEIENGVDFKINTSSELDYSKISGQAFGEAIGEMLSNEKLFYEKIYVDSSTDSSGSIFINEITVYGVAEKERCAALIKENTGFDKEVRVYE